MGPSEKPLWTVMVLADSREEADEHMLVTRTIIYEYASDIGGHEVRGMN